MRKGYYLSDFLHKIQSNLQIPYNNNDISYSDIFDPMILSLNSMELEVSDYIFIKL